MATSNPDALNSLLRGEISATETYNQALEKFSGEPGEAQLRRIRDEHREAANVLRQHVRQHGGEPDTDSGWWGTWATLVEGTAKLFGQTAALKALKEGEEHGIKEYREALEDKNLSSDCQVLIRTQLLPHCQSHIAELDRLMSA